MPQVILNGGPAHAVPSQQVHQIVDCVPIGVDADLCPTLCAPAHGLQPQGLFQAIQDALFALRDDFLA